MKEKPTSFWVQLTMGRKKEIREEDSGFCLWIEELPLSAEGCVCVHPPPSSRALGREGLHQPGTQLPQPSTAA